MSEKLPLDPLHWSANYHVEFAEIDDDHQHLIALMNGLIAALNEQVAEEKIAGLLSELVNYTAWHFRHEERLMQSYRYPDFIPHKRQHVRLIEEANTFQNRFSNDGLPVVAAVLSLLKGWLFNHVLVQDKKLAAFLRDRL
jgi:hemerythrin